jgi:hypothetical protein
MIAPLDERQIPPGDSLKVLVVARVSGGGKQAELNLDKQIRAGRAWARELLKGPIEIRTLRIMP